MLVSQSIAMAMHCISMSVVQLLTGCSTWTPGATLHAVTIHCKVMRRLVRLSEIVSAHEVC